MRICTERSDAIDHNTTPCQNLESHGYKSLHLPRESNFFISSVSFSSLAAVSHRSLNDELRMVTETNPCQPSTASCALRSEPVVMNVLDYGLSDFRPPKQHDLPSPATHDNHEEEV